MTHLVTNCENPGVAQQPGDLLLPATCTHLRGEEMSSVVIQEHAEEHTSE